MIQLMRFADRTSTEWKNGAGVTSEICVDQSPASSWRISIAELGARPSLFSAFPDWHRIFTIIGEHGVTLEVDGTRTAIEPFCPYEFDGAQTPRCVPKESTSAFNVMVDTLSKNATVARQTIDCIGYLTNARAVTVVYVITGRVDIENAAARAGDCVLVDRVDTQICGEADILVVEITEK